MFLKKNKKKDEFHLIVYKKDLSVDLNRILVPDKLSGVKEFFYVEHTDACEPHYHIYIKFDNKTSEDELGKIFYNSKFFISDITSDKTMLSILYFYTDGFRIPFVSSYSIKIEERRRINSN